MAEPLKVVPKTFPVKTEWFEDLKPGVVFQRREAFGTYMKIRACGANAVSLEDYTAHKIEANAVVIPIEVSCNEV